WPAQAGRGRPGRGVVHLRARRPQDRRRRRVGGRLDEGHFAWEYKRKRRNLAEAYQQLLRYREDLENPPLLVVCDLDRFQIHTNFTGTAKQVYEFDLDGLADPENLAVLRKLFTDPESLKPGQTTEAITQVVARQS